MTSSDTSSKRGELVNEMDEMVESVFFNKNFLSNLSKVRKYLVRYQLFYCQKLLFSDKTGVLEVKESQRWI